MKKLILFFVFGVLTFQNAKSQEVVIDSVLIAMDSVKVVEIPKVQLNWTPTFDEALEKSKEEKKPVLIYFSGSDWCAPCKVLDDKLFYTEKFKTLSDSDLVLLEVDIPKRKDLIAPDKMSENLYLQRKYKVKSFPTLIMVNHRGKKLAQKTGYIITEYYYPFFQSIIQKHYK